MVRQALDLLRDPVTGERLQGRDDAGMQRPPPLLEQAAVGDLVGERVLERVLEVRKEPDLVEELRGLEMSQLGAYLVLYPRVRVKTLIPIIVFFTIVRLPAWGKTLRSRVSVKPKVHVVDSGLAEHVAKYADYLD